MIGYVMVGSNDLSKSSIFYDDIFAPLGIVKTEIDQDYIGYAHNNSPTEIIFYTTKPFNKGKASFGNGT